MSSNNSLFSLRNTDEKSGDLILTNFNCDQVTHDEHVKKHIMSANPVNSVLEKISDKLSNLHLATSDVHSIELNLQKSALQIVNPSIAANTILGSIGVIREAKRGTYKLPTTEPTNKNLIPLNLYDIYLDELVVNYNKDINSIKFSDTDIISNQVLSDNFLR